jgi:hypothetical protein
MIGVVLAAVLITELPSTKPKITISTAAIRLTTRFE